MVHPHELGLPQTGVSGSRFDVGGPTSEEEVDKKKSRKKRVPKGPLTAVFENWLLSILYCRFFSHISGSFSVFFAGIAETIPRVYGNEDVSTGKTLLNTVVTAADAFRRNSEFHPWGAIRREAGPVINDLKSCWQKVVSRRRTIKGTRERWFGAETVASSAIGIISCAPYDCPYF